MKKISLCLLLFIFCIALNSCSKNEQDNQITQDDAKIIIEVEDNYIKWHYEGEDTKHNIVSLDELKGASGTGIASINKTDSNENVDTYTITYTNGTQSTFVVTNGEKGNPGEPGQAGSTPKIEIGQNGNWFVDGVDTTVSSKGLIGESGANIELSVNDTSILWRYEGQQEWVELISLAALKGETGKSVYDIYLEIHPEYQGTEEEWISDLLNGNLDIEMPKCIVTFDSKGGSDVPPQAVIKGYNIEKPADPVKNGYTFEGWGYDEYAWFFEGFSVSNNITLDAYWSINSYSITHTVIYFFFSETALENTAICGYNLIGENNGSVVESRCQLQAKRST